MHNLYLRFTGGEGYLINMNWFTFGKESVLINGKLIQNLTVADEEHIGSWQIAYNTAADSMIFGLQLCSGCSKGRRSYSDSM